MQLFQVNDGMFSGLPMEPFSETALEVKENLQNELTLWWIYEWIYWLFTNEGRILIWWV